MKKKMGVKAHILFICQANVGRSQMAEGFYNHKTNSRVAISAGVEDFREKYNFRPTPDIVAVMHEKGIDISNQRMDIISPTMVEDSKKVIVLCDKELCPRFVTESNKTIFRKIDDPFSRKIEDVRKIRDQIEMVVDEIISLNSNQ